MTEQERKKELASAQKQMKILKATIKELNNMVVEQPKLYDKEKFKEELQYLSTLLNVKYIVIIETEAGNIISSRMILEMIAKKADDDGQGYTWCEMGLSIWGSDYYSRRLMTKTEIKPTEFCNKYSQLYNNLSQDQHQGVLTTICDHYHINVDGSDRLYFGLTKQQGKHIKNLMEKYDSAPVAKIATINYVLDNFDKIDKRLGIDITEKQIKDKLMKSLKVLKKIHYKNLKKNVYWN